MKIRSSKNHPWEHVRSTKNVGPIGSTVLAFIGYKQTNIHPDRQAKFIYKYIHTMRPKGDSAPCKNSTVTNNLVH